MILLNDIKKALCMLLHTKFNYKVYAEEIPQDLAKPSFHIQIMPVITVNETEYMRNKSVFINITHFTENETNSECFDMKDQLEDLINLGFQVTGNENEKRFLKVRNVDSEIVDRMLQYNFTIDYLDIRQPVEEYDYMHNLNYEYFGSTVLFKKLLDNALNDFKTSADAQVYVR